MCLLSSACEAKRARRCPDFVRCSLSAVATLTGFGSQGARTADSPFTARSDVLRTRVPPSLRSSTPSSPSSPSDAPPRSLSPAGPTTSGRSPPDPPTRHPLCQSQWTRTAPRAPHPPRRLVLHNLVKSTPTSPSPSHATLLLPSPLQPTRSILLLRQPTTRRQLRQTTPPPRRPRANELRTPRTPSFVPVTPRRPLRPPLLAINTLTPPKNTLSVSLLSRQLQDLRRGREDEGFRRR